MKARISENGHLEVCKDGKFIQQYCPFRSPYSTCGLGCPLFIYEYSYEVCLCCSPHKITYEIIKDKGENKP